MSKFLKVLMVVALVAAMVAPAVAEDRLSLSGAMRVRSFYVDDSSTADQDAFHFDQRLRVGTKLVIAEGVSITTRTDITEGKQGSTSGYWGETTANNTQRFYGLQWDRAHLDIAKGMFKVRAGQQYMSFGNGIAFDHQSTGFKVNVGTAAPITLIYSLYDAEGSKTSANKEYYGANIGHKTDSYAGNLFVVADSGLAGRMVYLIGADVAAKLAMFDVKAELDYFGGDISDTVNAKGIQVMVDGSAKLSDTATVGGMVVYAQGQDGNDQQVFRLGSGFAGWSPETYGPFTTDFADFTGKTVMDFTGDGAGVLGFLLYTDLKVSDATKLTFSGMYAMPDKDSATTIDSAYTLNAGVDYKLMANTNLAAQVLYLDSDDEVVDTDASTALALRVQVKF